MGILNRTPDSFYDRGATFALDALLARAEQLVADGADLLDVGGVKAGPGPEVTEAEELDRVVPAIEALDARVRRPPLGRHLAGLGGPAPPTRRGRWWATTSAGSPTPTTCRRRPRPGRRWWPPTSGWPPGSATPSPSTTTWWRTVRRFLVDRAARAPAAGIPRRADRARRRARPGQDGRAVADPAAGLGRPGRPRLPAAAVGVQQDVPGRRPRPRHRRAPARPRWPPPPSGWRSGAGSCGSTTWPAPGGSATPGRRPGGGMTRWPTAHRGPRRVEGPAAAGDVPASTWSRGDDAVAGGARRSTSLLERRWWATGTPPLVVEEHGGPGADDLDVGVVVDACTTPAVPDRPAGGGGPRRRPPAPPTPPGWWPPGGPAARRSCWCWWPAAAPSRQALVKAVDRVGSGGRHRRRHRPGPDASGSSTASHDAPVRLDARAATRLGRAPGGGPQPAGQGMLETLAAAYGAGATVDDGPARALPGRGRRGGAVGPDRRHRRRGHGRGPGGAAAGCSEPGGSQPLEVLAILHRHYQAMLRLDGAGVTLGRGGGRAARHAQRLPGQEGAGPGPAGWAGGVGQAVTLLADADLDVQGRERLPRRAGARGAGGPAQPARAAGAGARRSAPVRLSRGDPIGRLLGWRRLRAGVRPAA